MKGFVRNTVLVVSGVLLLVLLVLQTALYIGRDMAVHWLLAQGAESAEIRRISINWFNGRLEIAGVRVSTPGQPVLRVDHLQADLDYRALLERQVLLSELSVRGADIALRQMAGATPGWRIGPLELPTTQPTPDLPQESAASGWQFGLGRLTLSDLQGRLQLPAQQLRLGVQQAELQHLYTWRAQQSTQLRVQGSLNGGYFELAAEGTPLAASPRAELTLNLDRLPVHSLMATVLPNLQATLSSKLALSITLNGRDGRIQPRGTVRVDDLVWRDASVAVQQQQLSWDGDVSIALRDGVASEIVAQGALSGQGSAVQLPDKLAVQLQTLDWQGRLTLQPAVERLALGLQDASLRLSELSVTTVTQPLELLRLGHFSADGLALAVPGSVEVARLDFRDVQLAQAQAHALTTFKQLQVDALHLEPDALLRIQRITLHDSYTRETLSAEGELLQTARLRAALEGISGRAAQGETEPVATGQTLTGEASTEETSTGDTPLRVQLAELQLQGDNRVYFEDRSTVPPFISEVSIEQAQLQQIDTASPALAPFAVQLRLGPFTQLTLSGESNLIGGGRSANWQGELQQLEMPRLSPYSIRHTGYFLKRGQLSLRSSGTLVEGQLEGSNHIQINRLDVAVADQDRLRQFSQQLSMPLGTAIMILQDSDDNIDLEVPVGGSLSDPDFSLQSIVQRLAGKGLKQAAFSFLTKSLQPYGALISLAKTAADAASKGTFISLQPVSFAAGSAQLDAGAADYLAKISSLLQERTAMRLTICGQAVLQDKAWLAPRLAEQNAKRQSPLAAEALAGELQQQLTALAQSRSDSIKQQLIGHVPGERLFSCFAQPALDDAEAQPVATLGL